jgi:hypothetical protein
VTQGRPRWARNSCRALCRQFLRYAPQQPGDISEGHPYRSGGKGWSLARFAAENGIPDNGPRQGATKPYLINEYGWLWINRDGSLPTLTVDVYKRLLGENATDWKAIRQVSNRGSRDRQDSHLSRRTDHISKI